MNACMSDDEEDPSYCAEKMGGVVQEESQERTSIAGDEDPDDESSSGFDDDDPRLQELFAQEPYPRQPSSFADPGGQFVIDENVIQNCWEWSVQQHNLASVGFWIAPNEEDAEEDDDMDNAKQGEMEDDKNSLKDWNPASLDLPSWAIP